MLAQYDLEAGRVDDTVISRLKESHALHGVGTTVEHHYSHAILVTRFALALSLRGAASCAARLLSCSERLFAEHEMLVEWWVEEMQATTLSRIKDELDSAELSRAWEQGQTLTIDEAVVLALRELERDA